MDAAPRVTSAPRLAIVLALVAAAGIPSAARADAVLAQANCTPYELVVTTTAMQGCTRISAHGGRVLWSTYEATARNYVLMTAYRGVLARVPVAPRNRLFDADLGEDGAGRAVATFSRCAGDPGGPRTGCVARQIVLGPGASERALLRGIVDAEPLLPSRWRGRVAIARRPRPGARQAQLCSAIGAPRCRTLPGGRSGDRPTASGPVAIDIDARRYAMAWYGNERGVVRRHAILVAPFGARKATKIVDVGAGYAGNASVHSPVLDGGYVYFVRGGASCNYPSSPKTVGRYDLARRTVREVATPALAGLAVDDGRVHYASCVRQGLAATGSIVAITAADPPPFDRRR